MKYNILESYKDYLTKSFTKNTAEKYYSSVKGIFKGTNFKDLKEVNPEFIKVQMLQIHNKNDFSAAKRGLEKLQEYDPSLKLPEKEFFKEIAKRKRNYVKSRGQKIYKDTISRKINGMKDQNLRLAYRLALVSGMRVSEIANLKKEDIDTSGERIKFLVHGKGGKCRSITCLNDKYVKEQLEQLLHSKESNNLLFFGAGHLMNKANQYGFECHDLRRIFAQDLLAQQIEQGKTNKEAENIVCKALGHDKIMTTHIYLRGRKVIHEKQSRKENK